ncbi:hypothetical protein P7K49_003833 [Saguinus oedipus]|uniref:UBC core domain-containing protein n=1 Tax=Saguinus oedipus TaxID=9490 RepID=A0ABQ9W964_SAGOE|nr:hypothetical protein P7K49_003833 [Saguinus oedipus]
MSTPARRRLMRDFKRKTVSIDWPRVSCCPFRPAARRSDFLLPPLHPAAPPSCSLKVSSCRSLFLAGCTGQLCFTAPPSSPRSRVGANPTPHHFAEVPVVKTHSLWMVRAAKSMVSKKQNEKLLLIRNLLVFRPEGTPFEDASHFQAHSEVPKSFTIYSTVALSGLDSLLSQNQTNYGKGGSLNRVYADGSICLDILQNRWSPTYDVSSILTSIQSLLDEPNPNSPANSQAAQLYQENKREYEKRVSAIVEQSWNDS